MSTEYAIAREMHLAVPWWRCRRYRTACRRAFASHFSRMLLLERAAYSLRGDFSRSARARHPSPFYALSLFHVPHGHDARSVGASSSHSVSNYQTLFSLIRRTAFSFIVHRSPDDTHTRNTWRAYSLSRLFSPPFPPPSLSPSLNPFHSPGRAENSYAGLLVSNR